MTKEPKDKLDIEAKNLLISASHEIASLRRTMNILGPKAEAYEALVAVITRLRPEQSQGASIDVQWQINEYLKENGVI